VSAAVGTRIVIPPTQQLSEPGELSHAEYGKVLAVEPVDVGADDVARTPVWYLFDDPATVYRLLKVGFGRWGQVASVSSRVGLPSSVASEAEVQRAQSLARLLEALHRAAAVGRAKVVDRGVLIDSGCVTAKFIDRVSELAVELGGDAVEILSALVAKRVKGFHTESVERLGAFFRENGYIEESARLGPEDVRNQVLADVADEIMGGRLSVEDLALLDARIASRLVPEGLADRIEVLSTTSSGEVLSA
jgi:hypothetical protein